MLAQINVGYFLLIALFSILYPGAGGGGWYIVPVFMLVMGSSLYWVHRLGHTLFLSIWFQAHVTGHHIQQYPGQNFSSTVYRRNTLDKYQLNTAIYIATAFMVLVIFPIVFRLSAVGALYLAILTACVLVAEDQLHYYIHTIPEPSFAADSKYLHYLWRMHRIHHSGSMKHNYAVLSLWLDWLYGSLKNP